LDVAWTSENEVVVCGGDLLISLRCVENGIEQTRKYETRQDHGFMNAAYDRRTRLLATSSTNGVIDVWDLQGQCRPLPGSHQGRIISLKWQPPLAPIGFVEGDERLLASSGEDGIIRIWNVQASDVKPQIIDMESPVLKLAFTPDGAFLAGLTSEKILIWKVGDFSVPRASWKRGPEPGWYSPGANSTSTHQLEDEHCLCWDANGQKLAYGVNGMLAVIDFRR